MNDGFRMFKPTALALIFIVLELLVQGVFCSSTSMSISLGADNLSQRTHSFGLGSPIEALTVAEGTSLNIRWVVLALNLALTYVLAAVGATYLTKATGLRHPATAYGLVAVAMIAIAFLASIGISKAYWGYFISKPELLTEVGEIATVQTIVPFKTENDAGKLLIVVDDSYSLSNGIASAKEYPAGYLEWRILLELERRNLIPATLATTVNGLPELYPLIKSTGMLANSSEGYDSSSQLNGVAVDATDRRGGRLVFLCLTGGQLSNDHYPYYELLFRVQAGSSLLIFARGQRFFYDAAGMEGFEWYVIWPTLAIFGIMIGFIGYTIARGVRNQKAIAV